MRLFAVLLLVTSTALSGSYAHAEAAVDGGFVVQRVTTPRGEAIEVATVFPGGNEPNSKGPFPAVIIGSGQGYDMRQPLMKQLTADLLKRDIAVYRFNWAYWLKTRKPGGQSADRSSEIEDFTTVLQLARTAAAVLRVEASRQCAMYQQPLHRELLKEAIRQSDLLLVHYADPDRLAVPK